MEVPPVPMGQISKLARQYYPSLPPAARAFIDIEDLIQYGAIRWHQCLPRFDRRRAGLSTFTHHVVRSWFLELIRTFKRAKHPQHILLPIEEIRTEWIAAKCHLSNTGAQQRIERLLTMATPQCREFLATYYFGGDGEFRTWTKKMESIRKELAWLIQRTGVTAQDFRACQLASVRGV
jgi:DNA-directed RNA polymerase specialized sigma24 family protein